MPYVSSVRYRTEVVLNKKKTALSRDSWIAAAFEALMALGPEAVAVEPLARSLGATKGSFYWHFANREDLLRRALEMWERANTAEVIALIDRAADDPRTRARALIDLFTASNIRRGELGMFAASDHPEVSAALKRVTEARIDYVRKLLVAAGFADDVARRRALLAYSFYLGRMQLGHSVPSALPSSLQARGFLADEFTTVLFGAK